MPRSLRGATILDIGAGDGRTFHWFADEGFEHYYAVDISRDLLAHHPQSKGVELFVRDVEEEWPRDDKSIDVVTSFFVLEHIEDLQHLADSVERVLTDTGVWIFTYFPQRREFIHSVEVEKEKKTKGEKVQVKYDEEKFKIQMYCHRYEEIEEAMSRAGLEVHSMDLSDSDGVIGRVYAGVKG